MLGDITLAEPGAVIGFAGARVIEETIRETLPDGFQRSEYLQEHGMVDLVVPRSDLKRTLGQIIALLLKHPARDEVAGLLSRPAEPPSETDAGSGRDDASRAAQDGGEEAKETRDGSGA